MPPSKAKKSLKQAAQKYNISQEALEQNIREAINIAFDNNDIKIQKRLKMIFPDGVPTPENFIETVVELIQ